MPGFYRSALAKLIFCSIFIFLVIFSGSLITGHPGSALAAPDAAGTPGPALTIDAAASQHGISPYIYGLNFAKEAFASEISLPLRRWGGNATSRYNWQNGNTNSAMDWYYENMTQSNAYTGAAETHTQWVDQNVRTSTQSLITIPMTGYVAKDSTSCGFSIAKYGAQQDKDVWRTDCGNGIKTNGSNLTGNAPTDTSVVSNPASMQSWVASLVTKYGTASAGGVKFYAMDNEPDLWGDTQRDIHPAMQSYDELYSKIVAYATAVKAADASAQVLGYSSFGWTGYRYSELDTDTAAKNGYTYFPDYQTHGNLYQVPWLLTQMHTHDTASGTRLLDYLDLHYYPAGGNALTTAGDVNMQALRLRSTRSLWDPTYVDESWIGGSDQSVDWRNVQLLPRMHGWVDTYYPGTKLAITEYNFGGLESINGALAQADVLGIFGREGLDMANLWNYPNTSDGLGYDHFETEPGAYAFRMYRNYDGSGGKFGDTSLSAASADQSKLAVYAARRSSDGALTLMVINKTSGTLTSSIALSNFQPAAKVQVYNYSSANLTAIVHMPDQAVTGSGFTADFPGNSITLLVVPLASVPNLGGCAMFPADNIWNARVDSLPINTSSDQWLTSIGKTTGFHMDFGSGTWDGGPIGIPFNLVTAGVPKYSVSFYYPTQSDPGPYPIGANPIIEYGSDHHLLTVDSSTCTLYEIFDASLSGSAWSGGSGAVFNLASNALRPDGWTSADAAGLPILPGLVRYDEIVSGHINHAIRFTAASTNGYIWPARHLTSNNSGTPQIPPMGARFRLKSTYNISTFSAVNQVILQAMKTYGIILADNGSNWYISGAPDERWNNDDLHLLDVLKGSDFEAVDSTSLIMDPNSGAVWTPIYTISGSAGVAGATLTYTDGHARTVTADSSGNYSLGVSKTWSGTVTPSLAGYTFTPASKTYNSLNANQTGQNYTAASNSTPPTVVSIVRASANPSSAATVAFTVTFSKSVTGVDATDFTITMGTLKGTSVASVIGSGATYTVTVNTGTGNGSLRLDVVDNDSINSSGVPLGGTGAGNGNFTTGEVYIIIKTLTPTFSDVPADYSVVYGGVTYYLHDYIQALYAGGLTNGCNTNPLSYCPDNTLKRVESAKFMLGAMQGTSYTPPTDPSGYVFQDDWTSPSVSWGRSWAEGLWDAGLTNGCSTNPLLFCPAKILIRDEWATFGLRIKYGGSYTPPAASHIFADDWSSPSVSWAEPWAEKAYLDGLLPACGSSGGKPLFCPTDLVTRAWAAYMLVNAKGLTPIP